MIEWIIANLSRLKWKLIFFGRRHKLLRQRTIFRLFGGSREIHSKTKHGIVLRLNPSEYLDEMLLRYGDYEFEVLQAILRELRDGEIFWDVGSNLGLHALTVKKKMPLVTVEAFEPNPEMYSLIVEACNSNHLDVNALQLGLSRRDGEFDFFIEKGNVGGSGLTPSPTTCECIRVFLASGDRLVREKKCHAPHVIKLDVELHELEACLGMIELLRSATLRMIIFEDAQAASDTPIKKLLIENGFRVRLLKQHNFIAEKL